MASLHSISLQPSNDSEHLIIVSTMPLKAVYRKESSHKTSSSQRPAFEWKSPLFFRIRQQQLRAHNLKDAFPLKRLIT